MNKHRDKFRHFARGRHRKGKFMRLAMIFLPLLLLFSMCSAFMGDCGRRDGRDGRHDGYSQAQNREFKQCMKGHRDKRGCQEAAPSASADVSASTPQANAQSQDETLDELTIIQDALQRALIGKEITSEQYNSIIAQETLRFTEKKEEEQKNEEAAPAASSNSSNQTTAEPRMRGESRRHNRRGGFSPIGFLIKLGLLFFVLSFIARGFGFRPWRQSLGFRRWQQAYADAWGSPVREETPVGAKEEDEDDDIARELEREEQRQQAQRAQQAQQKKAEEDQAAKSKDVSDDSKPEDKNAA